LNSLVLNLFNLSFLVDDLLIELLEEQCELAHGLLNALNIIVAGADGTEDARSLTAAVALEL
jgi:hypothetical protein